MEKVNLNKTFDCWLGLIVVDANFIKLFSRGKPILALTCLLDEFVGQYLYNFRAIVWAISVDLPLIKILFGVELNGIKRILFWFCSRNKELVIWRSGRRYDIPERFKYFIALIVTSAYRFNVIKVKNSIPVLKTIFEWGRKIVE